MNKLVLVAIAWTLAVGGACGAPPEKQAVLHLKPVQEKSGQAKAGQAKSAQAKPAQAKAGQTAQASPVRVTSGVLTPAQAIAAAAKAEGGAEGVFEFQVGSVGQNSRKGRPVFLNSEADYHSPKNLSVMIRPAVVKDIETATGGSLDETLAHKRIKVAGVARQVEVAVYDEDHKKTGETYLQTRITVTDADQIAFR